MSSYQDDEGDVTFDGQPGSFPKDFGYGAFDGDQDPNSADHKPRILLMGLRRDDYEEGLVNYTGGATIALVFITCIQNSANKGLYRVFGRSGKSSIQKVVFHKMSPNETLFLESTNKIVKDDINNSSFVQFQIWDFPGQIDFFDTCFDFDNIFGGCGALVFVIDAQDDYLEALNKLNLFVTKAYKINSNIKFEVFIHKVDGLADDSKMECQRDIHQRAMDDLSDSGYDQRIHLSFHLTSIYDHSIFEAFSKVVQKLIMQLPALENLLNILNTNSAIEKSFLFDVVSKIYIATDSTPVDMQSYELCCDMIDVVIDLSTIYGIKEEQEPAAFDEQSSSLIKLNNGTVLYLREVNKFLALVCILREDNFDHKGIIDYNFICFRNAIQQVFELRNKSQSPITNSTGSPVTNGGNMIEDGGYLSPTEEQPLG